MENKRFMKFKLIFFDIMMSICLLLLVEEVLESLTGGKKWWFLSVPMGILGFIFHYYFYGLGSSKEMKIISKRIQTEGMTKDIVSELEKLIIKHYNQKHLFHKLDEKAFENNNYAPFVSQSFGYLLLLTTLYRANDKKDKAVLVIEEIYHSDTFHAMQRNDMKSAQYSVTVFYITALELYMILEDMEKIEAYLAEAKPYMEMFKNDKGDIGAAICVTHVRYQYLKGNYGLALQWLNQFTFPESANIQMKRYEISSWLYYALGNMERSAENLKLAEKNCINQWTKDKLQAEYEDMKKKMEMKKIELELL